MNTLLQIIDDCAEFLKNIVPTGTEQYLMAIGAAIGLFISIAVGGMDKMIYALIALMILDYTTGMIAAFKTGQWDSSTGFVGLAKKRLFWLLWLCAIPLIRQWIRMLYGRWQSVLMPLTKLAVL